MEFMKELQRLIGSESGLAPETDEWLWEINELFARRRVSERHPFYKRTKLIFDGLIKTCGLDAMLVVVDDDSMFPALLWSGMVILGTSLERLHNDELAFVIAHELGHWGHLEDECENPPRTPWGKAHARLRRQDAEFEADAFARDLVIAAGWSGGGIRALQRMAALDPRSSARYGLWKAVPFVGWLIVKWKLLLDRWRYSHPSVESRIETLRGTSVNATRFSDPTGVH